MSARFMAKVDVGNSPAGCWLWTGAISSHGYGAFWLDGKVRRAHRVAYEMLEGPVPEGMSLDHLCRELTCVNPLHMEPVTHSENCRRGTSNAKGA